MLALMAEALDTNLTPGKEPSPSKAGRPLNHSVPMWFSRLGYGLAYATVAVRALASPVMAAKQVRNAGSKSQDRPPRWKLTAAYWKFWPHGRFSLADAGDRSRPNDKKFLEKLLFCFK